DRTLAWFPALSALASLVVVGVFAGLVAATGVTSSSGLEGMGWLLVALGYVALAFVGTYFLAALVEAADARLRGSRLGVAEALQATNRHLPVIVPWALLQGVVSTVMSALENRGGSLGQLTIRLLGVAWSVLTYLAVPIIVLENVGPISAL